MKRIGYFNQLKAFKAYKVNGILQRVGSAIPICRKCKRPIDVLEIKDRGPNPDKPMWMEIYAKCYHEDSPFYTKDGEESFCRVEFVTPCPPEMWGSAISTGQFFLDNKNIQE